MNLNSIKLAIQHFWLHPLLGLRFIKHYFKCYPVLPVGSTIWLINNDLVRLEEAVPIFEELSKSCPKIALIITLKSTGDTIAAYLRLSSQTNIQNLNIISMPLHRVTVTKVFKQLKPTVIYLPEFVVIPNEILVAANNAGTTIMRINFFTTKKLDQFVENTTDVFKKVIQTGFYYCIFNQETQDLLLSRGVPCNRIRDTGYSKMERAYLTHPDQSRQVLFGNPCTGLKIVVFGSIGNKEFEFVTNICKKITQHHSDVLFVIAPRKPMEPRIEKLTAICQQKNLVWQRMSQFQRRSSRDVIIYDAFGQLPSIYAVSNIILIGDSFTKDARMGHNFMEACALGKPVIFGETMGGLQPYADIAVAKGAAIQTSGEQELVVTLNELLLNEEKIKTMGECGKQFYRELFKNRTASNNIAAEIHKHLLERQRSSKN